MTETVRLIQGRDIQTEECRFPYYQRGEFKVIGKYTNEGIYKVKVTTEKVYGMKFITYKILEGIVL